MMLTSYICLFGVFYFPQKSGNFHLANHFFVMVNIFPVSWERTQTGAISQSLVFNWLFLGLTENPLDSF